VVASLTRYKLKIAVMAFVLGLPDWESKVFIREQTLAGLLARSAKHQAGESIIDGG